MRFLKALLSDHTKSRSINQFIYPGALSNEYKVTKMIQKHNRWRR